MTDQEYLDSMTAAVARKIRQAVPAWQGAGITPGAIVAGCVSAAVEQMLAQQMSPMEISNALNELCDGAREQAFRLLQALLHPFENMRNIYFGLMMGFSAGLPSFVHIFLFIHQKN
mgnify:CR=1 FL=1